MVSTSSGKNKQRLDLLLVQRGLIETRAKAQAMIMAGNVYVGGQKALKAGEMVAAESEIILKDLPKYVSRAGEKLESVAEEVGIDFQDKVVLDVGSSTGGFTDYALQHGATKVYAVDVGSDQLHYRLRKDPRVVAMERTDIRDITRLDLVDESQGPTLPDIAIIDVSFISLIKILPSIADLIKPTGQIIAMAKPQFEADKATADKFQGVISDDAVRQQILSNFESQIKSLGFRILASKDSGLAGTQGNLERFYTLKVL